MFCIIYKVTNKKDGKIYIGQTWQTLKERFRGHCKDKTLPRLYNAINCHGKENFTIEMLTVASTQDAANYWEIHFMEQHNSRDRDIGYNIKEGGGRGRHSEETKRKLSEINTGKVMSEEAKKKLSEAALNRPPMSEETKTKISASNTGLVRSEEARQNYREARLGTHHTEEVKAKISSSHRQRDIRRSETENVESWQRKGKVRRAYKEDIRSPKRKTTNRRD